MVTPHGANQHLSLTRASECCNTFLSSNDKKAQWDDLRGKDWDGSAFLLRREEEYQGDMSYP